MKLSELSPKLSSNLTKLLASVLASAGFAAICNFLTTLIIVKTVGATNYGGYVFLQALLIIPAAFYSTFPQALKRFVPTLKEDQALKLFLSSLIWQLSILVIVVLGFIAYLVADSSVVDPYFSDPQINFRLISLLIIISLPLSVVHTTLSSYLAGLQMIGFSQWLNALLSPLKLGGILALFMLGATPETLLVATAALPCITPIVTITVMLGKLNREHALFVRILSLPFITIKDSLFWSMKSYFRNYILPMQAEALLAMLRLNSPALALGLIGQTEMIAVYDVVTRLFNYPNKIIPALFNAFLPRLVKSSAQYAEEFKKKFNRILWIQLAIYSLAAWVLASTYALWLKLYALPVQSNSHLVVWFVATNLIACGLAQPLGWMIAMGKNTYPNLLNSLCRSFVFVTILTYGIKTLGIVAPVIALLTSSIVTIFILNLFVSRSPNYSLRDRTDQVVTIFILHGVFSVLFITL